MFIADIVEPFKCEGIKGDSTNWEIKKKLMYVNSEQWAMLCKVNKRNKNKNKQKKNSIHHEKYATCAYEMLNVFKIFERWGLRGKV